MTITCGACGSDHSQLVVRRLTAERWVTRCVQCSVAALKPPPTDEELRQHYSDYYLTRGKSEERRRRLVEAHRPILRYLLKHLRAGASYSFLDFGFGSGEFLTLVAEAGHRAFGADLSARAARDLEALSSKLGVQIGAVDLSSAPIEAVGYTGFDVITMFQVLEHIPKPLELVRTLARHQLPGGLCYIECPNDPSALSRVKTPLLVGERRRRMWRSLKHPEHLHGFNRASISALLGAAGYDIVDCDDYGYGDGVHQVESEFWWPSWRNIPKRWSPRDWSRSAIPRFDRLMSAVAGAGSGLFALGRKRRSPVGGRPRALGD